MRRIFPAWAATRVHPPLGLAPHCANPPPPPLAKVAQTYRPSPLARSHRGAFPLQRVGIEENPLGCQVAGRFHDHQEWLVRRRLDLHREERSAMLKTVVAKGRSAEDFLETRLKPRSGRQRIERAAGEL